MVNVREDSTLIHMPHRTLPGLRKWCRWRQAQVPVGHPHLRNTVVGRIFTEINNFIESW
jgi:hypothetical protein